MFQDKNGGKPIKEGKNIPKDSARGRLARGIREGKMPIKGEDIATKGGRKNNKRKSREESEKERKGIFLYLCNSQHHEKRDALFGL